MIFLFSVVFLSFSCKKKDITPAYLVLSDDDFKDCIENSRSAFNKTHNVDYDEETFQVVRQQYFRDVYVSLNGKTLGYWNLPCTIPLLPDYSSENIVRIIPCVRVPGTSVTTLIYNFVKPVERAIVVEKKGEYRLSDFFFEYREGISFPFLETFGQIHNFSSVDTVNNCAPLNIIPGESMGEILLNDSLPFFNIVTGFETILGTNCKHFWEFMYKSDGEMTTYLNFRGAASGATQATLAVYPSTKGVWKKAYIDISEQVQMAAFGASAISVRLGMRGIRNADESTACFQFKYVKLISMVSYY